MPSPFERPTKEGRCPFHLDPLLPFEGAVAHWRPVTGRWYDDSKLRGRAATLKSPAVKDRLARHRSGVHPYLREHIGEFDERFDLDDDFSAHSHEELAAWFANPRYSWRLEVLE
jgi:hypothetical protein